MYFYYQIGILVGLIVIAFSINIFRKCSKQKYPANLINFTFSFAISTIGICIIIASLAAFQPHNWYTSSLLWKMLISG